MKHTEKNVEMCLACHCFCSAFFQKPRDGYVKQYSVPASMHASTNLGEGVPSMGVETM